MRPSKEFCPTCMTVLSDEQMLREPGTVPVMLLFLISRYWRLASSPTSEGIPPVIDQIRGHIQIRETRNIFFAFFKGTSHANSPGTHLTGLQSGRADCTVKSAVDLSTVKTVVTQVSDRSNQECLLEYTRHSVNGRSQTDSSLLES